MGLNTQKLCVLQRYLLFQRRNNIVYPTNETVAQVFARLSAYRDLYDGPQVGPVLSWVCENEHIHHLLLCWLVDAASDLCNLASLQALVISWHDGNLSSRLYYSL